MLLDVVHDLSLLITDIQCSGSSASRGGEIGINSFLVRSVNIAGSLVEDESPFSAHQLQHQNKQQNFRVYLSVFSFYHPPHLFVIHIEQLFHQLFVLLQGELQTSVKIGCEVEQLRNSISSRREKEIFETVRERQTFVFLHHHLSYYI